MAALVTVTMGVTDNKQLLKRGKRSGGGCGCGGNNGGNNNNDSSSGGNSKSDGDGNRRHLIDAKV